MSRYKSDNVRYWKYSIPRNSTEFKLLMRRNETEWNQLYLSPTSADEKNEGYITQGIFTKRSTHTVTRKIVMFDDDLITMSYNGCVSVSSVETRHFMESTTSPDSSEALCSLMGQSATGNLIQVGPDAHK
ncbi:hypothetical protein JTB14_022383 [Gonioctena quinquepunctata]|nr:hypothetical protein JTB14_022383 [Gonioctena quinquepunctata]